MKKLLAAAVPALAVAAALALSACGAGSSSCSTDPTGTKLAAGNAVGSCTVAAGSSVSIPVRLCPACNQSQPSCTAELLGGDIVIDPVLRVCQEDQGCPVSGSCENDSSKNQVSCAITIPSGTPNGPIAVKLASTAEQVGVLNVAQNAGCTFSATSAPAPTP